MLSPPKPSTFSCQGDIKLVAEYTRDKKHIAIDLLEWDYDMKHGQIRKLTGRLCTNIVNTFGMNPPMQPGNVAVLQRASIPTPVTST